MDPVSIAVEKFNIETGSGLSGLLAQLEFLGPVIPATDLFRMGLQTPGFGPFHLFPHTHHAARVRSVVGQHLFLYQFL